MNFYSRKPTRIPGYDYSKVNYYFITICTHEKKCIFGTPSQLNQFGLIAKKHIENLEIHYESVKVDKYVVMPNHVHLILILDQQVKNQDISKIVGLLKMGITREIRSHVPDLNLWQRSFHDHVIRNQQGYEKIWSYIENNPLKWEEDCFYCE